MRKARLLELKLFLLLQKSNIAAQIIFRLGWCAHMCVGEFVRVWCCTQRDRTTAIDCTAYNVTDNFKESCCTCLPVCLAVDLLLTFDKYSTPHYSLSLNYTKQSSMHQEPDPYKYNNRM